MLYENCFNKTLKYLDVGIYGKLFLYIYLGRHRCMRNINIL